MKKTIIGLFILFISLNLFATNKIIVAGSGNPFLTIIDKSTGDIEWTHALEDGEECNSVKVSSQGEILYSYSKGAKLITKDHQVIWDYKTKPGTEVQSANLLPNGNYLLGICGNPAQLLEVNKQGKVEKEITIDLGIEDPHSQFRQITVLKNGNYLIPLLAKKKIMELTSAGTLVKEIEVEASAFSLLDMEDNSLVLSCGDTHRFVKIEKETGKEIDRVEQNDIVGTKLLFVAQIIELENGNLLICNWDGHTRGDTSTIPQLIEINKEKELVWSFTDKEQLGKISAVAVCSSK